MQRGMQPGTIAIFVVCFANLGLLIASVFYRDEKESEVLNRVPSKGRMRVPWTVILAFASQALYLALGVTWWFRWMNFYPGNPVQNFTIFVGIFLSLGAFVTAGQATGIRLFASTFVGAVTLGLWLLSIVASSVV